MSNFSARIVVSWVAAMESSPTDMSGASIDKVDPCTSKTAISIMSLMAISSREAILRTRLDVGPPAHSMSTPHSCNNGCLQLSAKEPAIDRSDG